MNRKSTFTRLLASLLIIATLITVSTACKSNSNNNTNSNNVSSNSSSDSNANSNSNSNSSSDSDSSSDVVNSVCEFTKGADIRVMSYNILHPEWSSGASYVTIVGRDTNLKNIINYYKPDVVGLQEACQPWHFAVDKYLVKGGDYAFACASTSTKPYNMTTMIYNKKTVKLIEEYVVDLDANSDIRVLAVAVFEKLSDGKRFVVTNTHPSSRGYEETYKRNMGDLFKHSKTELEKYENLPVIMTGDFNTPEQSDLYTGFISETEVKDAKYEADKLVRKYSTFIGWPNGKFKEGSENCIDHIFVNKNTDVLLFDCVIDHDVEKTSDHIPIYADIVLK